MAAGIDFLLKLGDGASPEAFTTIGGFTTNALNQSRALIENTNKSSNQNRQIIAGKGTKSRTVTGSGQLEDSADVKDTLQGYFDDGSSNNYEIVVPGVGTYTGAFIIQALNMTGPYDDAATWDITLESTGDITFTAEV